MNTHTHTNPSFVYVAVANTITKNNLRKERVYFGSQVKTGTQAET